MSNIPNTEGVRCPECGFRHPAGSGSCPSGGARQSHRPAAVLDWDSAIATQHVPSPLGNGLQSPLVQPAEGLPATAPAGGRSPVASPDAWLEPRPEPEERGRPAQDAATRDGARVVGRVIAIDSAQREPLDFDICRALTKTIWLVMLLVSPLLAFGHTLIALGPVIAVAGIAGVLYLLRFLPLNNIVWFAFLAHMNRRPEEQVPVWYARVRDSQDESEVMVRLKGLFSRGNVAPDDIVSFWGPWRDGVLVARHGFNHRTRTAIQFRQSNWSIWLALTLVVAAGMAWHLYGTWVSLNSMVR